MTKRERFLAAIVGLILVLGGLMYAFMAVTKAIDQKKTQIAGAKAEIREKRRTLLFAQLASDRMQIYERRALPGDLEAARSLYQTWLLQTITDVGLELPNVNVVSSQSARGIYHQLGFTLSGRGNLEQLVDFLYKFYEADYLHRIRRLHVKQIQGTKYMDISMSVEALSLPTATHTDGLSPFVSGRLAYGDQSAYLDTILARNLSGPANREPWFSSIEDHKAYTDETVSFRVSAEDPDKLDRLQYSIEADEVPGAQFDASSGSFRWEPEEPGEYLVKFHVRDDGYPPLSESATVRIVVSERPPEPPPEPRATPLPSFDKARFAYLTAIVETAGQRQAWINLRMEGKTLKLYEGEQFDVGEVPVTIKSIDDKTVEFEAEILEKQIRVKLGKSLAEGEEA